MKQYIKLILVLLAHLLPATATAYDFEVDGIYYNIKNDSKAIVTSGKYDGEVNIPSTVTYNGTIYSVTAIDDFAFFECVGLTSVAIPNSVATIGWCAFENCLGLTRVNITDLTAWCNISFYDNPLNYAHHLFLNGEEITDLVIPNIVTTIGSNAFVGCNGLTSVSIPNSVTAIGSSAFEGCTNLTEINIPNTITAIGSCAFDATLWYENQPDGLIYAGSVAYKYKGTMPENTNIIFKEGTLGIAGSAFSGCSGLISVNIPNSVTTIGDYAFSGCYNLASIEIPNTVISIGVLAFDGTQWFDHLYESEPDGVIYIGLVAYGYKGTMPEGTNLTIKDGTVSIAGYAFCGCQGLTSISLPKSLRVIGDFALAYYTGLSSVCIPSQVEYIGDGAFDSCFALEDVYCYITDFSRVTINYAFGGESGIEQVISRRVLHVPSGTLSTYQENTNWSDCFGSIVEMEPGECNYFSMDDTTVMHGDTIVIPVAMTNSESIIGFQTDIFLPEGLELLQEDGEYMIDPSGRMTRTHSIMSDDVSNGAVRVLCYSSNYKPFTGESGEDLFYLTVKVADDAEGDYTIQLQNTLLTTSDFEEIAAPDVATTVNVKAYILGDANNSGTVTVTDVVVASQYILEQNPQPFVFDAADVNADGAITVTDVSRIAWMVLNPTLTAPKRAPALWNNGDNMSGEGISLSVGETRTMSISLYNEMDYTAFQLDLALPDGLTAGNFRLTDRAGSHAFDVNTLADGKTRALCYSPALTAIRGNEGALLTFDVTATGRVGGDILVDGIELVTTDCRTVRLEGFAVGVDNVTAVNEVTGGKTNARVDYFNLAGQQIERPANGVTLVVTTYTDGIRTTTKVIK